VQVWVDLEYHSACKGPAAPKECLSEAMNVIERNVPITLIRHSLDALPEYQLPAGYEIRSYVPGDEHAWIEIHRQAERFNIITMERFIRAFGTDSAELHARQLYLRTAADEPIGTATAWFACDADGAMIGRVHWVALIPAYQGRGLSKPLLARVCQQLHACRYPRAYLVTSTARLPAINLYLQFGFVPWIRSSTDQAAWQDLAPYVPRLTSDPGRAHMTQPPEPMSRMGTPDE